MNFLLVIPGYGGKEWDKKSEYITQSINKIKQTAPKNSNFIIKIFNYDSSPNNFNFGEFEEIIKPGILGEFIYNYVKPSLVENYDYIIWIDADAFFYTDSNNIVDIINKNINVNFIFSKDLGNTNINTGFFIVKNTQYSIDFINKWAYDEELYKNNPIQCWWDQGVFVDMYNKNILDIQNNQISYDYGVLQHFDFNELSQFQDKPFIFHLASKSNLNRKIICTNYYNVFIKNSFD